ncbi:MAG: hypothetical protein HUU20_25010 [Pirellulales bacterium]|nr:hypothetical protein [Pirellulales bacterium]
MPANSLPNTVALACSRIRENSGGLRENSSRLHGNILRLWKSHDFRCHQIELLPAVKLARMVAAMLRVLLPLAALGQGTAGASARFKSLKCPAPTLGTTWEVLERDGAGRDVEPYLSSLGHGEAGTGVVTSPSFIVAGDKITFTLCGHDGPGGGRGENYIALIDVRTGETLLKAEAPANDAMQERSWDVSKFQGIEARIEVYDGNSGGAFAWLGVGRIDAGAVLRVDFRQGIPDGWNRSEQPAVVREELVPGGIPFLRNAAAFSLIPKGGVVEIPCGFSSERLFFLGCTVPGGQPLTTYGSIEVHYRTGSPDVFPLMCGFTLDGHNKLLSPSKAIHLHASSDPFQHYLAIRPRQEVIEKIRLVANPDAGSLPRITAITCETPVESGHLGPLPDTSLSPEETAWIADHTLSADSLDLGRIVGEIRKSHKMPE